MADGFQIKRVWQIVGLLGGLTLLMTLTGADWQTAVITFSLVGGLGLFGFMLYALTQDEDKKPVPALTPGMQAAADYLESLGDQEFFRYAVPGYQTCTGCGHCFYGAKTRQGNVTLLIVLLLLCLLPGLIYLALMLFSRPVIRCPRCDGTATVPVFSDGGIQRVMQSPPERRQELRNAIMAYYRRNPFILRSINLTPPALSPGP